MKIILKITLFLSLISVLSCGQKEKWTTYRDPAYPISIGYLADPNKMSLRAREFDESTFTLEVEPPPIQYYSIDVDADFSEIYPDAETLERAYGVTIYKDEIGFCKENDTAYKLPVIKETQLNGTPAILISNPPEKYEEYILLTPSFYVSVYLSGLAESEKITRNALKHFKWNQEIDTTSEEFRKWKEHIWEILKSGTKK